MSELLILIACLHIITPILGLILLGQIRERKKFEKAVRQVCITAVARGRRGY